MQSCSCRYVVVMLSNNALCNHVFIGCDKPQVLVWIVRVSFREGRGGGGGGAFAPPRLTLDPPWNWQICK